MSIYVAGKWGDRDIIRQHIKILEEHGFQITHNWALVEKDVNSSDEKLAEFARLDVQGVLSAGELLIIITDEFYPYRGTSTELGVALALNKPVYILDNFANSAFSTSIFTKHHRVKKIRSIEEYLQIMR